MNKVRYIVINAEVSGQRLDNFLFRTLKGVPKSHIYKRLRRGEIRVNKKRAKPLARLQEDDVVRLPPIREGEKKTMTLSRTNLSELKKTIIYEDKYLIAINKPAGIAVHGGSGISFGAIEGMRAIFDDNSLELAHRLDRDTSGCLLVARKRSMLHSLHAELRDGKVEKVYLGLVAGIISQKTACNIPLVKNVLKSGERIVTADEAGKPSSSFFYPQEIFSDSTLVRIEIKTGRTHQIRVHARFLTHPVIGDNKYGDEKINRKYRKQGLKRLFLHAESIRFTHPEKENLKIKAPPDESLQAILTRLRSA